MQSAEFCHSIKIGDALFKYPNFADGVKSSAQSFDRFLVWKAVSYELNFGLSNLEMETHGGLKKRTGLNPKTWPVNKEVRRNSRSQL